MIFDTIANAERYAQLHPMFPQVFEYTKNTNLHLLASGRHSIAGDDLFAIVERVPGRSREVAQLECHRKYIDIQLVLDGTDEMGWKSLSDCHQPVDVYNAASDIQFFHDTPATWLSTPPNTFCIFFPEDTHAPLVAAENIHKVVFKIAVNASAE
ncbi:MAG: YhcH/YjgK/YiaL family protein [Methylotenera sp.]|uniref:YhcH/YjgK/YiaL family protein n=1 Tax=Methylotenera sp. TaxID=2051956 RepID=UPI00271D016A|nr:YhcH/YjgK/YiaL family protein [Methylotenera sp.]MDO9394053.1 YhcH/YjgK/YiaL family protein [Methylotenera sp.]MDP2230950.1 YhcH/YjgK/YiaL family protein [Methylotenera sp.]MDP3141188.1 YhcH/YjgK/YiaL family protein [Methylotenera sp.]